MTVKLTLTADVPEGQLYGETQEGLGNATRFISVKLFSLMRALKSAL